jgi:Fe-S-cluster containining protein
VLVIGPVTKLLLPVFLYVIESRAVNKGCACRANVPCTQCAAALVALAAIYREVEALYDGASCDGSTECCRFAITGREPQLSPLEFEYLMRGVRASPPPKQRALNMFAERRCPLLKDNGRCSAYAHRPFGCRTFYCHRAKNRAGALENPMQSFRAELRVLGQRIATLSAQVFPTDPHPRAITTWLKSEK